MPYKHIATPSITLPGQMGTSQDADQNGLGAKLRELRLARGLTLRDAGNRLGVSHGRIREFEVGVDHRTGKPVVPSPSLLVKMADVYGFPEDALLALAGLPVEPLEKPPVPSEAELDAQEIAGISLKLSTDKRRLLLGVARLFMSGNHL